MDSMAREHLIREWKPFDDVKVYTKVNKFALSLACRLLLGIDDPIQVQKFSDTFRYAMSGFYSMPVNFPGTSYHSALKEIGSLKKQMLKIIQDKKQRLKNSGAADTNVDILSWMLMDPNFKSKPESEIAFNLITLLIPSHESTSSAAAFVLKYVAEFPSIHDMVYKEMMAIANSKPPEELLNWEDIQKMKYSWCVINESLRLTPPGLGTFREATKNLNFAGYTIPEGWKVCQYCSTLLHSANS
ncbi:OLC1v1025462C2 [Oldenlandia corymbosa var. corymbosa]|uniref:OLC1v1025462C2 n=1 Tax=Oldenlandia corymbosa var. corymbosa TaxID=529605 RepID=A0AAV1C6X7_OLDCO|nr:OLC1v1025462C2 [Oldenlandia corymbosa var. corymbosa]